LDERWAAAAVLVGGGPRIYLEWLRMKKIAAFFAFAGLALALTAADYVFIVSDRSVNESRSCESEGIDLATGTLLAADEGASFDSRVWTKAISETVNLDSRRFFGSFLIVR
jgi:hypothetical protein